MLGHGNENGISFFGYFGFGWPLLGFLLSVAVITLLAILNWPIPAAFFALLSLGLLYGVYKSCQTTGREGVNVPRMRTGTRDHILNRNVTDQGNQITLELAASTLTVDHPRTIGSFPPSRASFAGLHRSPAGEDQPPDYYEVTEISKSVGGPLSESSNSTWTGGERGWPSSGSFSSPFSVGDLGNPPVVLFRLPSYDEAVASSQRMFSSDSNTAEYL